MSDTATITAPPTVETYRPPQCRWEGCEEPATMEIVYDNGNSIAQKFRFVACQKHADCCRKPGPGRATAIFHAYNGDHEVPGGSVFRDLPVPPTPKATTPPTA